MDYIYPPRPKTRIPPGDLPKFEKSGDWVVQRKFKGTRNLVHICPNGRVEFWGRHGERHKQWTPTKEIESQVLAIDLQQGSEYWLDSELLHNKVSAATDPYLKNRIVLFDVLMVGRYLVGSPDQMTRLAMLKAVCRNPNKLEPNHGIALQVSENLWMAETFERDFSQHFQEIIHLPEIEGLVLRKRNSVIDNFGTVEYETSWQIRCRKPEQAYQF
jgi:hypothetical protein